MFSKLLFGLIIIVLGGCHTTTTGKSQYVKLDSPKNRVIDADIFLGRITEKFASNLDTMTKDKDVIIITSQGGEHAASIRAAHIIRERQLTVIVLDYCLSACAELLLPAAHRIEFLDDPLIGFHWGPMMLTDLLRRKASTMVHLCDFHQEKDIKELYKKTGHKVDFWETVHRNLKVTHWNIIIPVAEGCPTPKIISTNYRMWFPTTKQLTSGLGLRFEGKLCADDVSCYTKKVPKFWPNSSQYMVGDNEFIVK